MLRICIQKDSRLITVLGSEAQLEIFSLTQNLCKDRLNWLCDLKSSGQQIFEIKPSARPDATDDCWFESGHRAETNSGKSILLLINHLSDRLGDAVELPIVPTIGF
ncbi:unnamed protein product [Protopolystoma xenopodis]|uniref:Uncharacterized protein n=1 Tax=Protopolystoma xenopodis TaxID=117903 RepID=A0A3S4ZLX1_9PLAT|nr:unnamed protein product [Protopolystoma xenopodis]